MYFAATEPATGRELWRSDGTAAGTVLLADVNPATLDSSPRRLANVNGTLFFAATTPETGTELWKSDGTPEGTVLVKDILPGPLSSIGSFLNNFYSIGGLLFFAASDGVHGSELWRSDGTAEGTYQVAEINPTGDAITDFAVFVQVGNSFYFRADDGTHGVELWKSDGTAAGTVLVRDINPGAAGSSPFTPTAVGSTLYFGADDGVAGRELWKTDGTPAGTALVKDINPGPAGSGPVLMNGLNGLILFTATEPGTGRELYRSDGTAAGTVLLRDINPGPADSSRGSIIVDPPDIPTAVVGGSLYFKADDGVNGFELWKSDGTPGGTALVKDINPGPASSMDFFTLPSMIDVNGTLFFRPNDGTHGIELWRSDGTAAGTVMVVDINPGPAGGFTLTDIPMVNVNGTLFFRANNGVTGVELWRSDGTAAGTALVRDIFPGAAGSVPTVLTDVNGTLFFSAVHPAYGRELWKAVEVVQLDIKPGEEPNSINLKSNGNIPVAVLSTPDFDATTVDTSDPSRLRFGDVRLSARVSPTRSKLEDVDGDGDLDLLLFFSTQEIRERGALVADSTEAELTGFTVSGQFLRGTDAVRIVNAPGGKGEPVPPPARLAAFGVAAPGIGMFASLDGPFGVSGLDFARDGDEVPAVRGVAGRRSKADDLSVAGFAVDLGVITG
jgi:ELWxxDGT repeat protein